MGEHILSCSSIEALKFDELDWIGSYFLWVKKQLVESPAYEWEVAQIELFLKKNIFL